MARLRSRKTKRRKIVCLYEEQEDSQRDGTRRNGKRRGMDLNRMWSTDEEEAIEEGYIYIYIRRMKIKATLRITRMIMTMTMMTLRMTMMMTMKIKKEELTPRGSVMSMAF